MKQKYVYLFPLFLFFIGGSSIVMSQKFEHSLGIEGLMLVQNSFRDSSAFGRYGPRRPYLVVSPRRVGPAFLQVAYHVRFSPVDLKKGGFSVSIPMNISFFGSTGGGGDYMVLNVPVLAEYSIGYDPFFNKGKTRGLFAGVGGHIFYTGGRFWESTLVLPTASIGMRVFTGNRHVTLRYNHGFSTNHRKRWSTQSLSISLRLNKN